MTVEPCEQCDHTEGMHCQTRGCRQILELGCKTHDDNFLCGCGRPTVDHLGPAERDRTWECELGSPGFRVRWEDGRWLFSENGGEWHGFGAQDIRDIGPWRVVS